MNNIQNYGITNYQVGFQANKNAINKNLSTTQTKIFREVKDSQAWQEQVDKVHKILSEKVEQAFSQPDKIKIYKYPLNPFMPEKVKKHIAGLQKDLTNAIDMLKFEDGVLISSEEECAAILPKLNKEYVQTAKANIDARNKLLKKTDMTASAIVKEYLTDIKGTIINLSHQNYSVLV